MPASTSMRISTAARRRCQSFVYGRWFVVWWFTEDGLWFGGLRRTVCGLVVRGFNGLGKQSPPEAVKTTNHEPRTTNHEPRTTNHEPLNHSTTQPPTALTRSAPSP